MRHDDYMKRCLQLAEMGLANVAPNPMVGAVLVHEDRIIGEGYHMQYGQAHAEVNCIKSIRPEDFILIDKSTLYVSLEPCNHFGKTPPCTDLIVHHKIPRLMIGCKDPFSKVNGIGIQRLKEAGVEVIEAVLEKEATELNKRFFTFHQKQRPYIILKWAQTQDGFIGMEGEKPIRISSEFTDRLVHRWRSEESAIMVGTNTAVSDNPALTTRLWPGNNPVRVVLDLNLRIPPTHQLLDGSVPTIILNSLKEGELDNIQFFKIPNASDIIPYFLKLCIKKQLLSLMVEGGSHLIQSFIDAGCWDEARIITNTSMKINRGVAAPVLPASQLIQTTQISADQVIYFKNN